MPDLKPTTPHAASCDGCTLVARRDFLRSAAATALLALGAPAALAAAPVELVTPIARGPDDATYPLPTVDGARIDRDNDTILARWQGKVYVFDLACPHQSTVLRWSEKRAQFECPKHHSRFMPDGIYIEDSGRATRGLDRFAVRREGDTVVANLDQLYRQDKDAAAWNTAFLAV